MLIDIRRGLEMSIPRHRILFATLIPVLAVAAAVLPASPALAATWTVVPSPNASAGLNLLFGVDAVSTTDVWAVGRADHAPEQPFLRPFTARLAGGVWTVVTSPVLSGQLSGVDGSSATNVWAVGHRDTGTLVERWNGSSWSIVSSPAPSGSTNAALAGVKTFSTTDAWAVGNWTTSTQPFIRSLIQRWNGSSWSVVPSPSPDPARNLLTDVDGASANDVWAIGNVGVDGYGETVAGLVLRWNGSAWSRVTVPGADSDATFSVPKLEDVVAISSNDVWIVGRAFHRALLQSVPYALHWNGTSWQRSFLADGPGDNQGFSGVTALSSSKVYAFGSVVARWTGSAWVQESVVPGVLSDATAISPATVWAAGYRYDQNASQLRTLAVRTTNG
jgi:hypothetical protein